MPSLRPFRKLFRLDTHRTGEAARDIDDELDAHLALRIAFLESTGLSASDARTEAERRFGDVRDARQRLIANARRRSRSMRWLNVTDALTLDVRFAVRQMVRAPRHALFGIGSLALGIGLATAFFATVNGVLLRPLPFDNADRLVAFSSVDSAGHAFPVVSADDWHDWSTQNVTLDGIALHGLTSRLPVVASEQPIRISAVTIAPGFFTVLRSRFRAGRDFDSTDAMAHRGVIVSEALWTRAFGARAFDRAGATVLRIGDVAQPVIGVVERGQEYPPDAELWLPYAHHQIGGSARNNVNWFAIGRLRAGQSIASAERDIARIARGVTASTPEALYSYGAHLSPLRDVLISDAGFYLKMLLGAVSCVLLIACVNLASINLARGTVRAREMAVRAAIGANRLRLARQLLIEHVTLSALGGMGGVVLSWVMIRGISAFSLRQLPRADEISIDSRVLLFALLTSIGVGLLTGVLPAMQAGRTTLAGTMAAVGRGTAVSWNAAGRALVTIEIALAVVLAIGGGLLLQSFRAVLATPLGYETRGVVTAELSLSGERYQSDPQRMRQYWEHVLGALRASSGVSSAGVANWIPLGIGGQSFFEVDGQSGRRSGGYRVVSGGYLATMKISLLAGRDFSDADIEGTPRVAMVSRRLAEAFWPGENPIGKRVRAPSMEPQPKGAPAPWLTVVGVVGDVRHWGAERDVRPEVYVNYAQLPNWWESLTIVVRAGDNVQSTEQLVRTRLREQDALVAADIEPFSARLSRTNDTRRVTTSLLLVFGVLALALAAIGVYSVLAFQVAQRTRELAVRSALGAERRALLALVLASGARLIGMGAIAGLLAALAFSRVLQAFVFQISARDPLVFSVAWTVIVIVAFAAALVPALRATRIQPMLALKLE